MNVFKGVWEEENDENRNALFFAIGLVIAVIALLAYFAHINKTKTVSIQPRFNEPDPSPSMDEAIQNISDQIDTSVNQSFRTLPNDTKDKIIKALNLQRTVKTKISPLNKDVQLAS